MPYYKLRLKIGHQGIRRYREIDVPTYAEDIRSAIENVRHLPMVKHTSSRLVSKCTIITEEEFLIRLLDNMYKSVSPCETGDYNPLSNITRNMDRLQLRNCQTPMGQKLIEFCDKYMAADEEMKEKIEQKYEKWAAKQIAESEYQISIVY